jgi:hypothetical protein
MGSYASPCSLFVAEARLSDGRARASAKPEQTRPLAAANRPLRWSGPRGMGWAAIVLPDLRRSGWLSPEDHGDPYHTMRKFITIFLNRS